MSLCIRFLIDTLILIIDFILQMLIIWLTRRWSISRWALRSAILIHITRPSFVAILFQFRTCHVINLSLSTAAILLFVKNLVSLVELAWVFYLNAVFLCGLISV